jgi:DNA-binding GntR family transcriptional regulator
VASRYGISRTPVREAFRQLAAEGFLWLTPRRGARVAYVTEKDITEFYELKSLLEGYAARLATPKLQERDLQKMEQLNDQMERYHLRGDLKRIAKIHNEFHNIFLEASGNEQLTSTLQQLVNKYQRFTILLALSGKNPEAVAQHRDIINAFRTRDAERAETLVKANALLGKELMIKDVLQSMAH